jgi:hypothetical protein
MLSKMTQNRIFIAVQKFLAKVSFWHLSVRPGVFSKARAKRPTRPSNMNFVAIAVQKFLAKVSFWHLSVRPGVFSKARAKAYPALKYELRSYSRSKVLGHCPVQVLFVVTVIRGLPNDTGNCRMLLRYGDSRTTPETTEPP